MTGSETDVAVVIPVLNGAHEIRSCIEGILGQSARPRQIIAIDSGSTDDTLGILSEYPAVDVVKIGAGAFNHGETRNLGASLASAEFVVFTVQDAHAASEEWIAEMLSGFTDASVAGVCGIQIVAHDRDKNPISWFRPSSEATITRYQFTNPAEFDQLSDRDKAFVCGWDNVTAMYRSRVLRQIPFRRTSFGEDMLWARDALGSGHALVYNSAARVYHYHEQSPEHVFRRALATVYQRYHSIGLLPDEQPLFLPMMRAMARLLREPTIDWRERAYWSRRTFNERRAVRRAVRLFRHELANGASAVETLYERYCGEPAFFSKSAPDSKLQPS